MALDLTGKKVVLVVINSSSLSVSEQAVRDHLLAANATIALLQGSSNQAAYTAAFNGAYVGVVCRGSGPTAAFFDTLGTPLVGMGMIGLNSKAVNGATANGTAITAEYVLNDASDPITGPSTGLTTIANAGGTVIYLYLTASELASSATLMVAPTAATSNRIIGFRYDRGAVLTDGVTTAPYRMVAVSWMDASFLNATGWQWFDNAIVWASALPDNPPVANAGPDQSVAGGATVTLDGTGSTDPDFGDYLNYSWLQVSGPTTSLSNPNVARPTLTAPSLYTGATLVYQLYVTDNHGQVSTTPDTVTISVAMVDTPPVANAGPDQAVVAGSIATLDGTGSTDPDAGDTLTYAWSQTGGPLVGLSSPSVAQPSFTAPTSPDILTFQLVVTDSHGQSSPPDSVSVSINPAPLTTLAGETVVIIVASAASLSASDLAVQSHLTNLGATVNVLQGSSTLAQYQAAFSSATFGVICKGASAGGNLDALNVSVLSMSGGSKPHSLASSSASTTGTVVTSELVVQPPTDFITGPSAGQTTFATAGSSTIYTWLPNTSFGPGVVLMLEVSASQASKVVGYRYDAQSVLSDGTTLAPYRMVTLGLGDASFLNATGWQWVDQAIKWITGLSDNPPTADAGPNQAHIAPGATFTLDGTASTDPDFGDAVASYSWVPISPDAIRLGPLANANSAHPTGVAPSTPSGAILTYSLVVTDQHGVMSTNRAIVTIDVDPVAYVNVAQGGAWIRKPKRLGTSFIGPNGTRAPANWPYSYSKAATATASTAFALQNAINAASEGDVIEYTGSFAGTSGSHIHLTTPTSWSTRSIAVLVRPPLGSRIPCGYMDVKGHNLIFAAMDISGYAGSIAVNATVNSPSISVWFWRCLMTGIATSIGLTGAAYSGLCEVVQPKRRHNANQDLLDVYANGNTDSIGNTVDGCYFAGKIGAVRQSYVHFGPIANLAAGTWSATIADPTGNYLTPVVAATVTPDPKTPLASNVNLANPPAVLDGVTLQSNDRILIKDQATPSGQTTPNKTQNGVYIYHGAGQPLTRAPDMASGAVVDCNIPPYVPILGGTVNGNHTWYVSTPTSGNMTVDTTAMSWSFQALAFVFRLPDIPAGASATATLKIDGVTLWSGQIPAPLSECGDVADYKENGGWGQPPPNNGIPWAVQPGSTFTMTISNVVGTIPLMEFWWGQQNPLHIDGMQFGQSFTSGGAGNSGKCKNMFIKDTVFQGCNGQTLQFNYADGEFVFLRTWVGKAYAPYGLNPSALITPNAGNHPRLHLIDCRGPSGFNGISQNVSYSDPWIGIMEGNAKNVSWPADFPASNIGNASLDPTPPPLADLAAIWPECPPALSDYR